MLRSIISTSRLSIMVSRQLPLSRSYGMKPLNTADKLNLLKSMPNITVNNLIEFNRLDEEHIYRMQEIKGDVYRQNFNHKLYRIINKGHDLLTSNSNYDVVYIDMKLTTDPEYYARRYGDNDEPMYFELIHLNDSAVLVPQSHLSRTILLSGLNPILR